MDNTKRDRRDDPQRSERGSETGGQGPEGPRRPGQESPPGGQGSTTPGTTNDPDAIK